jgi:hypothetical protein
MTREEARRIVIEWGEDRESLADAAFDQFASRRDNTE